MPVSISLQSKEPLLAVINLPSSKSISNRMLLLRYLCGQHFEIENLSDANDSVVMQRLLLLLQIHQGSERLRLDCEDAGTVFRFILVATVFAQKHCLITGTPRLLNRPIDPLLTALKELGFDVSKNEHHELLVNPSAANTNTLNIDASASSQLLSALLMLAPFLPNGLTINSQGLQHSLPYIQLTLDALNHLQVSYEVENGQYRVNPFVLQTPIVSYTVEADWSAASYFFLALAIKGGSLYFPHLRLNSSQGDRFIYSFLKYYGLMAAQEGNNLKVEKREVGYQTRGGILNLKNYPDLAIGVVVAACCRPYEHWQYVGLESLAVKESDRTAALAEFCEAIGQKFNSADAVWELQLQAPLQEPSVLEVKHDHRLIMGYSLAAFYLPKVIMEEGISVKKSFPNFFKEWEKLGFRIELHER